MRTFREITNELEQKEARRRDIWTELHVLNDEIEKLYELQTEAFLTEEDEDLQ